MLTKWTNHKIYVHTFSNSITNSVLGSGSVNMNVCEIHFKYTNINNEIFFKFQNRKL